MTDSEYISLLRKTLTQVCNFAFAWMADMTIEQVDYLAKDPTISTDLNEEAKEYLAVLKVIERCTDNEIAETMREAPID